MFISTTPPYIRTLDDMRLKYFSSSIAAVAEVAENLTFCAFRWFVPGYAVLIANCAHN